MMHFLTLLSLGAAVVSAAANEESCQADGKNCDVQGNELLQRDVKRHSTVVEDGELIPSHNSIAMWFQNSTLVESRDHAPSLLALGTAAMTTRSPNDEEKAAFITMHNLYRCMHGVEPLTWSDAMTADAERYIRGMTTMEHSDSYNIRPPAGPAGENLAWSSGFLAAGSAVTMWYEEVNDCATGDPESFTDGCARGKPGRAVGHFTAMIWKGAKELGCAFSNSDGPTVIICRYKAGDQLDLSTPNMNKPDNYPPNVLVRISNEDNCSTSCSGGGGGGSGADSTTAPAPEPEPESEPTTSGRCRWSTPIQGYLKGKN